MKNWNDDGFCTDEEEFVDVDDELVALESTNKLDARRRLEMMLEEKKLLDDIDDFH